MTPVRRFAVVSVALVALLAPHGARAADSVVVAGPGAYLTTYATPVVPVQPGSMLTFVNGDIQMHDVVPALGSPPGPDRPWCAQFGFAPGSCPLFFSEQIGIGRQTPVYGTESLVAGQVYEFICSIHNGMVGELVAVPA